MIPLILAPLIAKLAESGLNLIGNAVLNKGKDFVEDKLGVSLDDALSTDEGKQKLLQLQTDREEMLLAAAIENRKIDFNFYEVDAKDRDSARDMNARVNESEYSSWLTKNIVPILALIVVVGGGLIIAYGADTDVKIAVVGIITLVLGFYFGTSASSKTKDTTISNMAKEAAK